MSIVTSVDNLSFSVLNQETIHPNYGNFYEATKHNFITVVPYRKNLALPSVVKLIAPRVKV